MIKKSSLLMVTILLISSLTTTACKPEQMTMERLNEEYPLQDTLVVDSFSFSQYTSYNYVNGVPRYTTYHYVNVNAHRAGEEKPLYFKWATNNVMFTASGTGTVKVYMTNTKVIRSYYALMGVSSQEAVEFIATDGDDPSEEDWAPEFQDLHMSN